MSIITNSVSVKIFLISLFSMVGVLSAVGLVAYYNINKIIRNNLEDSLRFSVTQGEYLLQRYMLNIESQLIYLSNTDIYNLNRENYNLLLEQMHTLYWNEVNAYYVIEAGNLVASSPESLRFFVSSTMSDEIYEQTTKSGFWWSEPYEFNGVNTLTVAKSFSPYKGGQPSAVVALNINLDALMEQLSVPSFNGTNLFLITKTGRFIGTDVKINDYDTKNEMDQLIAQMGGLIEINSHDEFSMIFADEKSYKILKIKNYRWDWYVFSVVNEADAYPSLRRFNKQVLLFALMWILCSVYVSYRIAKYIKTPIFKIVKSMNTGIMGDLSTRIVLDRKDEFGFISVKFNQMMESIGELFENLKLMEEKKRYQELKLLQLQIDPHFMYNTLKAMVYLSETDRIKEIGALLQAFIGILHYSLDKVDDILTLKEELNQVKNYIHLMKLRYGNIFDVDIMIPDQFESVLLPKLTVVTLVENSIFYGLNNLNERNHIVIIAKEKEKNHVMIEVSDTGQGMKKEMIASIFNDKTNENNFKNFKGLNNLGLRNVHERIQLHFGEQFGLTIESEVGSGTSITIKVPYRAPIP